MYKTGSSAGRWLLIATVAITGTLAGCAKIPSRKSAKAELPPVPVEWVADEDASRGPVPEDWLFTFGDARLLALVSEALEYNNDLGQSASRLEAARASFRSSRSGLLPSLSGGVDASMVRLSLPQNVGFDSETSKSDLSFGLSASWEADLWGRVRNRVTAAYADARAARGDFEAAQLSVAGAVAQSWYSLIEARLQTELARKNLETRERTLNIIERRYNSGLLRSLDVRLARSDVATNRSTLEFREQSEKEAARALEILLGRYPSASIDYMNDLPPLPALDSAGVPSDILTRRPDLKAAELRVGAAGLRAHAARKALLPTITLSANLSNSDSVFTDLFDAERLVGNFVAGLTQPIFQGGRLVAEAKAARARAEEALYGYLRVALNAFQDAENALAAEARLAEREAALQVAFDEARAAERLTERDYAAGLRTIFNLLDAQTRRFNAESQLLAVRRQRLTNRIQLHLAVAGPFSVENIEPARVTEGIDVTLAGETQP